jgi:hypothetical protein
VQGSGRAFTNAIHSYFAEPLHSRAHVTLKFKCNFHSEHIDYVSVIVQTRQADRLGFSKQKGVDLPLDHEPLVKLEVQCVLFTG